MCKHIHLIAMEIKQKITTILRHQVNTPHLHILHLSKDTDRHLTLTPKIAMSTLQRPTRQVPTHLHIIIRTHPPIIRTHLRTIFTHLQATHHYMFLPIKILLELGQ
jgi:hypothetical protein